MDFIIRVIVGVSAFYFLKNEVNCKHTPSRSIIERDNLDLQGMMKLVMKQNRRLVAQNERLQQIWSGMHEMCKAIKFSPCECGTSMSNSTPITEPYTSTTTTFIPTSFPTPPKFPLQILSINSSGSGIDPTTVSINYTATQTHTAEWIAMRKGGAMWRTAGRKSEVIADRSMFTCTVDVEQLDSTERIIFYLHNDDEIINLIFNLTELSSAKQQTIIAPTIRLFNVNSSYMAPSEGDLNITTYVNKSVVDSNNIESMDGYFSGINTTSSELFEIYTFNSDDIRIDLTSPPIIVVTVGHPYVQFGGQLTLRYQQRMTGMVTKLHYGPLIKVFAPGSKDLYRKNSLAIYPLKKETLISPPSSSLMCVAIGNPRPAVSVLKIISDGKRKEMPTETVDSDKNMILKVLTLSSKHNESTDGSYICRASNGNRTIEAVTTVISFEIPVFDDTMTGIVQNDSEVIVISCKARGKPKPELSFRLYDAVGPDLGNAGIYKVWEADAHSNRVTLTIPSADGPVLHTLFCTASQRGKLEAWRIIQIYPGLDKQYEWELYDRLYRP